MASGAPSALPVAAAGATVLVHYRRAAEEAESVVTDIRKADGRADSVTVDLAAPDGAHRLAEQVRAIVSDRLDILVANAGISKVATIEDTTVADFDNLFAVNVRAPYSTLAELRFTCRGAGHPLHDRAHANDLSIAASALHIGAPLLTHRRQRLLEYTPD